MGLVSVLRRAGPSTRSGIEAGVLTVAKIVALAVFCAGTFCFGAPVYAVGQTPGQTSANPASQQQPGAKPPTAAAHSTHSAKHTAHYKATKPVPPAPVVAVVPPPAPLPDWPVNDKAQPASVSWNGRDLTIAATNSSLQQILTDVSTATGVKVEGEQSDQRIFGSYGPAPAREVLSQLLDGSGYNVLIIGDKGEGTPRELVLSAKSHASSNPSGNVQPRQNSDDDVQDEPQPQPEPEQPNPLQRRFPMQPGQGRTPEQMQQEQQQRLQLQQQLQQNPQQPNPPQPNPQQPNE